jgi:hypothetical protein
MILKFTILTNPQIHPLLWQKLVQTISYKLDSPFFAKDASTLDFFHSLVRMQPVATQKTHSGTKIISNHIIIGKRAPSR